MRTRRLRWILLGLIVGSAAATVVRAHPTSEIIDASGDGAGSPLELPTSIDVDVAGNAYIAGRNSDTVFRIEPDGTVTEIIDGPTGPGTLLDGPTTVMTAPGGDVYVAGHYSDNVVKIDPSGTLTEIIDASGDGLGHPLDAPSRLALGPQGNVYVTGYASWNAFEITPDGAITEIVDATGDGLGHTLSWPQDVAIGTAGEVYVTGSERVFRIAAGGTVTVVADETGDGQGNVLDGPRDVVVDPATGFVYVSASSSHNVFRVAPDGSVTEILNLAGDGRGHLLLSPNGLALGPEGQLYVAGATSDNVFEITSGGIVTEVIDATGDGLGHALDGPTELAVDANGRLYVSAIHGDNAFVVEPSPPHDPPPDLLPLTTPAIPMQVGATHYRGVAISAAGTAVAVYVPSPNDTWTCVDGRSYAAPHPHTGIPVGCGGDCFHVFRVALGISDGGTPVGYEGAFGSGVCLGPSAAYVFGAERTLNGADVSNASILATDMNAGGRIVGVAMVAGVPGPVTWSSASAFAEPLPSPPGLPIPEAVNDAGVIVGGSTRALLWEDEGDGYAWTHLGELPGGSSSAARDVNAAAVVVGTSDDGGGDHAVLWRPGSGGHAIERLPVPFAGGTCEKANGISDSGYVVGVCTPSGGEPTGVAWQIDGAAVEFVATLAPLGGDSRSNAQAVNDAGLVTGSSGANPEQPVVWQIAPAPANVPLLGPAWMLTAGLLATGLVGASRLWRSS